MAMTFQQFTEGAYQNAKSRNRLLGHLSDASKSVGDRAHPVHEHLRKAAAEIGAVAINDRSEDKSGKPSDFTSPGTTSSMSSRPGQSTSVPGMNSPADVAARAAATQIFKSLAQGDRSTLAIRKQRAIVEIYTKAAKSKNSEVQRQLEAVAKALDRISLSDAGEAMSEMDVRALKGEFGEEATRAAMNKAQSVATPFQELIEGANKGRRNFAGRHGF